MPNPKNVDRELSKGFIGNPNKWSEFLVDPLIQGDMIWREKPVDLEKWLYDDQYMNLGSIRLSPIQFGAIEATDCIDPTIDYPTEFVIEWGKGSGKDLIAALMALRQIYRLLCLRDAYSYYGMVPGSGIELCNVAYTKAQAKEVYFKVLRGLILGSRSFSKHKYQMMAESIKFPFNITMLSKAADGDSAEGQNMFFAVMDEASAFKDANTVRAMNKSDGDKVQSSAESIYSVLRTSTRSRFPKAGKVVIISYPRYKDDFIQTKRKENEKLISGWTSGPYSTWEVNPLRKKEDFTEDYIKNPESARAMYECLPPFSIDSYVKNPAKFIHAIANGRSIGLENPLDDSGSYSPFFEGRPGKFYAIHVDLALNRDRCAMALACQGEPVRRMKCPCNAFNLKGAVRCMRCQRSEDQWIENMVPTLVVPLVKFYSRTGVHAEVDFGEVREDILWIRERKHYIWSLTYDGWQSQDSIQIMDKILGMRRVQTKRWGGPQDFKDEPIVGIQSVDRNTEAYDTLKDFINDGRAFFMPGSIGDPADEENQDIMAVAYREWRSLRLINGKKVDHPRAGSKDATDSLAGVALAVSKMPMSRARLPFISGWSDH